MGKINTGLIAIVLAVVVGLCLIILAASLAALHIENFRESVEIVQSIFTIIAIVAGGLFAWHKWQEFRESEPHLTITHEVSHRPVGDSYVHIAVTAVLHNSSKVHIELSKGFFRLQQVRPAPDADIEALYAQVFVDGEFEDIQWPRLEELSRTWNKGELIVEPGATHPETCEFIVSTVVQTVNIYTYFYNSTHSSGAKTAEGWGLTTVHDMMGAKR